MQVGMIGLGRMGGNMVERLIRDGHRVVAYDRDTPALARVQPLGATAASSMESVVSEMSGPRIIWVMVPAGDATESTITALAKVMDPGDLIIDGGNSNFRDGMRRGKELAERKLGFIDAGTSGGVWGLDNGYCLMVGGTEESVALARPIFTTLAPEGGFLHAGPVGSGHFVKMVHNGIEYALLAAYGEGFEILKESEFPLDLPAISELWRHASVVRSWLLDLLTDAYAKNPEFKGIAGFVEDSGEGRWTVAEAIRENVPAPVITLSLLSRLASRQDESYSAKVISALRNEFGGHPIKPE